GSAAPHGPACGGTVMARAQRHTHGLCDVDGLAGLQGAVAADADGDGAQSVQVVRGAPERIVPGAHEDLVPHHRVTATAPALAGGDVVLPARFDVPLAHQAVAPLAHPLVGGGALLAAGVDHRAVVGGGDDRGALDDLQLRSSGGAVDRHPVALPGAVGVQRVGQHRTAVVVDDRGEVVLGG